MIQFERFVLNNGLKLLIHKDASTPMAVVNVLYDVGARDEKETQTGFAHLFEHLMFGGSINIPDYDDPLQLAVAVELGSAAGLQVALLAAAQDLGLQRQGDAVHHRVEQVGLVAEVPVDGATGDPCRAGDLLQRGARHAAAQELALGHVEDAVAGALGVFLGAAGHGCFGR